MTDLKAFDADPNRLWSDTNNMTAEAREAALRERLSALHAGETGHMHRCARVNGTWSCASGCAMPRAAAAEADARVVRAQLGELLRHCDVLTAECCVFAVAASLPQTQTSVAPSGTLPLSP